MKPTIKIIYSLKNFNGKVTRLDKQIDKAMESIGYVFYGCGYDINTQERDLGYEPMPKVEVEK